ncbi:MAG: DUF1704 domain-containing protein [Polyangiaceae bacterium]|nr:DUF1704 domain-containing protein [Polyangiaceae bacterium]
MIDRSALARRLGEVARSFPLVHAASPLNWRPELARLTDAAVRKISTEPQFVYPQRRPEPSLIDGLGALAERLAEGGEGELAGRVRAVLLDLRLVGAIGSPGLLPLARLRFGCSDEDDGRAARWACQAPGERRGEVLAEDRQDPRSVWRQAEAEIAARRLPVRVALRAGLPSLAAFGQGVVLVAAERRCDPGTARRTALHEVVGHAAPWWERQKVGGWLCGEEQDREEGLALRVEEAAGLLDEGRRRELGLRHVAARLVHEGASFLEVVESMEDLYVPAAEAAALAARALRGGGLGRERAYLPWYWREGGVS